MWPFNNLENPKTILPSGNEIIIHAVDKISYRKSEPGMMLQYSTFLDIDDVELLQSEINEIWMLFEKQANESGLKTASISASSPPAVNKFFIGVQQTRHFVFKRDGNGFWQQTKPAIDNSEVDQYQINFGVIENRNDVSLVFKDLTSIPLLTRDTEFYFGFTIFPPNNNPYNYHFLWFTPEQTKISNETGEIIEQITSAKDAKPGFHFPTRRTSGITTMPMWFDSGDPSGEYRIECYVNDVAIRSVDFTVYDPQ